jgi:soluble lytic murein transglycosylase-like protein
MNELKLFENEDKFDNEILKVSQEENVPFALLKGIIALESNFNPKEYKYEPHIKDASYGLMQILYKTAKGLGFKGQPYELYDPYTNIKYGAKYIKNLMTKYNNIYDIIASYNMGFPRPASKTTPLIIKIYGEPKPDWIYANQPYVDRVASYTAFYQAKYIKDFNTAQKIFDAIKKKDITKQRYIYLITLENLL